MKKLFIFITLIPMIFMLASCKDKDMEGKVVIDFWHMSPVGSPSFSPMKQIINEFNDSQDKYFVKGTGFSFWDYWDKISLSISGRTAPDLGLSTIDDVYGRAKGKVLYNISELIENDESENNIDLDEFRESQLEFARYEGSLYALPFTATARALYYNLDILAEKGYDEDDIPTTWSELKAFAKEFDKVQNGEIVRLGFDPTYGNATYHGWLWQTGEDFFDEELNPTLNTATHVMVLNWIKNFNSEFTRAQLQTFGESNNILGIDPFAAQRVAMIVHDDGLDQKIKDAGGTFRYSVAPIPVPDENGIHVNWGSGFSIEMYDNGKNDTARKEAAFEFLKFLMSKETQIKLAKANGWLMSHKSAMVEYTADKPILKKLLAEVDYAMDKVYVPYAPSWHGNDWQPFYTQALEGTKTVEQALADARAHYLQKKQNWETTNK
ncbi:extracellular solute-binding protein [Acholeplasma hippikon]|uniref:Glycerol-3-phosphate transporter periplasmic binding protein n=1 Tax=Acholeplasma hippikon TaxID=264636 RepID=A0A449BLK2_9MOLU|nr:extracellular solute-binding protein [Acholeplasma hippikon]VEU83315.1 glycerol-3-phosphate transporter periplasmic binding protein [Acholeplasma hippikon]